MGGSGSTNDASLQQMVDDLIKENKVMVFSKTTCPYCAMAKQALTAEDVTFKVLELNDIDDGPAIQKILSQMTGASTVPRVFINGKCIGGGTETKQLAASKKLKPLVEGTN